MDERHLLKAAERISTRAAGVGVVALDQPRTREMLRELSKGDTRVVTIASDVSGVPRAAYVGIDNRAAGRVAALLMGRFLAGKKADLAIMLGSRSYRGHEQRETGFRSLITEEFTTLNIRHTVEMHDARNESYEQMVHLLKTNSHLWGIYCVGGGRSGIVRAIQEVKPYQRAMIICHDLTANSRQFLLDRHIDFVIDQNAHLIAEQSVIALLGSVASALPSLTQKFIEPKIITRENIPVVQ